jgi:hypothetical protein
MLTPAREVGDECHTARIVLVLTVVKAVRWMWVVLRADDGHLSSRALGRA